MFGAPASSLPLKKAGVAEVIGVLDGTLTLGRAVDRVVRAFDLDKREAAELRRDTIVETEELLAFGIAELLVR